ncbi:MAG: hypothetical protein A2X35_02680 [Elusimicrobia bacterium GWA2_61_42]|nr:MAG: hypothetical protein A2X35_02680 [Elusimicrobia bacterium GWA2_61_42]
MFGFGKQKIGCQDFIELFYDFAHQVGFEAVEHSPQVYEHYFPGIDRNIIETERFLFIIWALDLKLSQLNWDKRQEIIVGLLMKYLKKIGKLDGPWQPESVTPLRNKHKEYYEALGTGKKFSLENKFIRNIFGTETVPENERRVPAMSENMQEIMAVMDRDFTGKYKVV